MAKLVSKTYGDALFEVALESGQLDAYLEDVSGVRLAIKENPEFSKLMGNPRIGKEEKIKVIESIFKGKVSGELVGLLRMIVDKNHFDEVEHVLDYFVNRVKEYKKIGTAYVTTAVELSESQKIAVKERLLEITEYVNYEMHYAVDAALIGGMVIRIGDRVVDSSVRTKLYDLTRELSKIQLKAGECAS
ncbi:MAG: ATP synthase F1 subunit delta [Clostridiales bacterium]|nr:ATP synthase F1 subunit delta [Clostridiales bacterium]